MTLVLDSILIDCQDPARLGEWWANALHGVAQALDGDDYTIVTWPGGAQPGFQRVTDPTPGKNRVHIDFVAAELDSEVARLESLGAAVTARSQIEPDTRWAVLTDPEGNVFCVGTG